MSKDQNDLIKRLHESSFRAIIQNYGLSRLLKSVPFISSFTLTLVLACLIFFYEVDLFVILTSLIDLSLTIIPSLLGFSLGGFAIIVSFNDKLFLKKISTIKQETEEKLRPSLFQRVIAVFAWGILNQAFALILTFLVKIFFDFRTAFSLSGWPCLDNSIIYLIMFLPLMLSVTYSLFLIPFIIKNVYGFGQMINLSSFNSA